MTISEYPKASRLFLKNLLALLLVFFLNDAASGQRNVYDTLLARYQQLDIPYFEAADSPRSGHPFFRALRAKIQGDEEAYIKYLRESLQRAGSNEAMVQIYANKLYFAYVFNRQREQAFRLNKQYGLGQNKHTPLDLKASDFPAPSVEMEENRVSVPFDQFYFHAVLNETDTVKVFFDTGAPGVSVSQELVERYGWATDTSFYGFSVLPAFGIRLKTYPTLIPSIKIGGMRLNNLFAKYGTPTEEEQERMRSSGIEDHDILLGLTAFDGLIDGVAFDYKDSLLHFTKTLPEQEASMNFLFAEGKPAIRVIIGDTLRNAFLDTGSPRHVVPESIIEAEDATFNREAKYGSFTYGIYDLEHDQLLNLERVILETADYGFTASEDYDINILLGSFLGRELHFDLRNRIVTLRE